MTTDEKTIREQLHTLLDMALDTNGLESRRRDMSWSSIFVTPVAF